MKVRVTVEVDLTGWAPRRFGITEIAADVLTGANEYAGPTELISAVEVVESAHDPEE